VNENFDEHRYVTDDLELRMVSTQTNSDANSERTDRPEPIELLLASQDLESLRDVQSICADYPDVSVSVVDTIAEAIQATFNQTFDILMLELAATDQSGLAAVRRLNQPPHENAPALIAFSDNPTPNAVKTMMEAGFVDYLSKPIDPRALWSSIDALVTQRRHQN
jgi:DNA-binding response OmpR family regulator